MCGIAGVFGRPDEQTISAMLDRLAHRGPDDRSLVSGDRYTLGVRRLAIVDPEHGRQPIANEDGTIWACQNGELYNFPLMRPRLVTAGHQLKTSCDTEMLPHLYEDHGTDLPRHIDGMFAVALWDAKSNVGVIARDRMGKKPLYYLERDGALYFASELKALLELPGFERHVNLEAVHHFLGYKHVPHPMTIFEGVAMLPPGHRAVFRPGQPLDVSSYWRIDFSRTADTAGMTDEEVADELERLLRQGVRRRLMSDVPVGFFLSGGLDSSLCTALAAEEVGTRISTFTLTYADASTTAGKEEDRKWARWVAERYGTEHHEEAVEFGNFPDAVKDIVRAFDEPFAGALSTYFLSSAVGRHVKVALAGDGADELFGSYRSHRLAQAMAALPDYQRTGDRSLLRPFHDEVGYLESLWAPEDWQWRARLLVLSDSEKESLYSPEMESRARGWSTAEHLHRLFSDLTANDPLNRILEAEFRSFLPDQVLTFVDRLSMAHSLELRSAFLDTDVVEFVARLDGCRKIRAGVTKYALKQVALRFFPEPMVHRPKEGFIMPITEWMLSGLEDYVRDTLAPAALARHGLFDAPAVQRLVDDLYARGGDHTDVNKVFVILMFQEWHDQYMR